MSTITAEQAAIFEQQGYLTGIPILDEGKAGDVRKMFDALEAREGKEHCQTGLLGRHLDVRFIWEMAAHAKILDAMETLMGHDIMVLSTHVFCKYPSPEEENEEKFVAWHQDVTYWGLEPAYALTAWYAIDDADVENGCMQFLPGTHRQGILEHGDSKRPGNLLSINQEISQPLDESQAVDITLKAGQISIHHGHLIHGSNPNHSNRRRGGLTLRYCPPHVKPVQGNSIGKPWPAVLARGEDRWKHFGDWKLQFS